MADDKRMNLVQHATDQCGIILHGLGPNVQGAVLADLLAVWLAGHQANDKDLDVDAYRSALLAQHLKTVRRLVPLYDEMRRASHQQAQPNPKPHSS